MDNLVPPLHDCVKQVTTHHLDNEPTGDMYRDILAQVEDPMLEMVMRHTRYNMSKAARILGLNRGTLRKKLKQYGYL